MACNYLFLLEIPASGAKVGGGWGAFLRRWPHSAMWAGPFIFYGHHRGWLNNPIFSNLGLCAACWAHFMCHLELWPTSVSHPFSFLSSSLGVAGGKHYEKLLSLSLELFFEILLFQITFLLFFSLTIFSHYFLLVVCKYSMWLCFSQGTS